MPGPMEGAGATTGREKKKPNTVLITLMMFIIWTWKQTKTIREAIK